MPSFPEGPAAREDAFFFLWDRINSPFQFLTCAPRHAITICQVQPCSSKPEQCKLEMQQSLPEMGVKGLLPSDCHSIQCHLSPCILMYKMSIKAILKISITHMHSDCPKGVCSLLPQAGCISQLLILSVKVFLKSRKHFMNMSLPTSFCRYWHGSLLLLLQLVLIRGLCTVFLKWSYNSRWWNSKIEEEK